MRLVAGIEMQMARGTQDRAQASTEAVKDRLHKFLASTGAGSRRECETFIQQGRVTVNGKVVTKMGLKVDPTEDKVTLDGEKVKAEEKVYYLLNKPSNTICTNSDERGRQRVVDLVPDRNHRIYTVGRLDADSRGLILLTNDGGLSNIICHPRYRIEKVYQVAVRGRVDRQQITKIEAGVWLAEGKSSPARVRAVGRDPRRDATLLEMTVFEGRNREIRRVLARVGLKVKRLQRTKIGPLKLGTLPPGACVKLDAAQLQFVHDAERLYAANRELWDAELPTERKPKVRRSRKDDDRPRTGGRQFSGGGQRSQGSSKRSQGGRDSGGRDSGGRDSGRGDSGGRRSSGRDSGGQKSGGEQDTGPRQRRSRRYYS